MSLGVLTDEASLKRWLEQQLDVLRPAAPDVPGVKGVVSSAGAVVAGTRFSVNKTGTGTYVVSFNSMGGLPAVEVTPITKSAIPNWALGALDEDSVEVRIWNQGTGTSMDCEFSFRAELA